MIIVRGWELSESLSHPSVLPRLDAARMRGMRYASRPACFFFRFGLQFHFPYQRVGRLVARLTFWFLYFAHRLRKCASASYGMVVDSFVEASSSKNTAIERKEDRGWQGNQQEYAKTGGKTSDRCDLKPSKIFLFALGHQ